MHHDWHIDSTLAKMDGWHCRLLRRTMKVKTTMIDSIDESTLFDYEINHVVLSLAGCYVKCRISRIGIDRVNRNRMKPRS